MRWADAGAVALILLLTIVASWRLFAGGVVAGLDSLTQFYPWYSYLGESLRSGTLPGWNPHQLSGTPFAGDPLSGWSYLPAMLFFTLLPLTLAAKGYLFFHLISAGIGCFALARALGIRTSGALLAAVAYEFGSYLYIRNACCFAYASVMVWLPVAILGAEMAIKSRRLLDRGLWCALSGLAVSQMLAAWLGQGSYYALLVLGGYVAYRTLLFPPAHARDLRSRLLGLSLTGGAVLLIGFCLAAAGLFPRLEYNALSGLAGGYPEGQRFTGGLEAGDFRRLFLPPDLFYGGAIVMALALAAPLVARRGAARFALPYFAVVSVLALTLAGEGPTLLHSALELLPYFGRVHPHDPERILVVFYLGAALLAGAALTHLGERGRRSKALISLPLLAALFLATRSTLNPPVEPSEATLEEAAQAGLWEEPAPSLMELGVQMPPGAFVALLLAAAILAAYALLPARLTVLRGLAVVLLVLVVFWDLNAASAASIEKSEELGPASKRIKVDLDEYYEHTQTTDFLRSAPGGPSRYLGLDPRFGERGSRLPYHLRFDDLETQRLETANRATLHGEGMQSIQGYNAVHLARYDRFLEALNGRSQNYHDSDVFPAGLDSPRLDLLNVRYIVVPDKITSGTPESLRGLPVVSEDGTRKILENPEALPRAWIVHSARQAGPEEALDLLSSGEVDPRETALLAGEEPPPLEKPDDPSEDRTRVTGYESNRIELSTATGARGMLVLSEVYYPGWKAYVDGEQVPLHRADYLLRAVPVPAGEHTVELRYEPWTLRAGTAVSLVTALGLAGLIVVRVRRPGSAGSENRNEDSRRGAP